MKIIFLNAWYGELKNELGDFIESKKMETDIFCFQKFSEKMENFLKPILIGFNLVKSHKYIDEKNDYYMATYINKKIEVKETKYLFTTEKHLGLAVNTKIKDFNLWNVHGFASPGNKLDSSARLEQSKRLIEAIEKQNRPMIIGGDFNLNPETESVLMFEKAGFRNLIKEYKIETTRNHYAWDLYPDNKQPYADYLFVNKDVKVKSFEVLDVEISDHLPMVLEIEG